jgi:PadR family transcriptional regulator PadR
MEEKVTDPLGQFEQLVLTAVQTLDDGYGITIHARVQELAERPVKLGPVYVTLERLQDKGYVSSRTTAPTPEPGGRAKRCFQIEEPGRKALHQAFRTALRMAAAVERKERTGTWNPVIAQDSSKA